MPTAKVSYDVSPRSREMQPSKRSDCARIIHLSNVTSIEEQWRKKAVVAQREAELNKALADKYRRESEDLRSMLARLEYSS